MIKDLYTNRLIDNESILLEEGELLDFANTINWTLNLVIENPVEYIQSNGYKILKTYTNWKLSYMLKKKDVNLLEKEVENSLLIILNEVLWKDNIVSVWVFGSYINWENNKYSDYDFFIVLDSYENDDIYEREKNSPIIKKRLFELGITDLFAFNFYSKEELDNSKDSNPFLIETMKKSYYMIKDDNEYIDNLFYTDNSIKHKWGCTWLWEFWIDKERINVVMKDIEYMLSFDNNFKDFYDFEKCSLEYFEMLNSKWIFTSRLNFWTVNTFLDDPLLISDFFNKYKKNATHWKAIIWDYSSFSNNYSFANQLSKENNEIWAIKHYYFALKNILSSILHNSWIYIIDWEFTQSFIQNFWNKLPSDILDIIFNSLFKSEQIIWRTWLLSFDLDENWNFIYENWKFDYISLINDLNKLIEYFKLNETNITLENKDKILIITDNTELVSNQIFPKNKISYIQKNKLDSLNISEYTYILVHNNNYILSTDYLIKSIAYLQSGIWDLVSWKRVTNKSISNNKFSNFMFKWEDFKEYWEELFKKQLTFVWTEYFPK